MLRLSDEFRNSLGIAAETFHQGITSGAVSYLHGRGISTEAIIEHKLGTVNREVSGYDDYTGMISIPYLTTRGGVVAIKARVDHDCTPDHDCKRYLQAAGEGRLYNTPALDKADHLGYVGICEGELDAIILSSMCGIPTVGIPGVDHWAKHQEWPLIFRGYRRVLMFRDNDEPDPKTHRRPGHELAKRITKDIDTAEVVILPEKDATIAYMSIGRKAIREIARV